MDKFASWQDNFLPDCYWMVTLAKISLNQYICIEIQTKRSCFGNRKKATSHLYQHMSVICLFKGKWLGFISRVGLIYLVEHVKRCSKMKIKSLSTPIQINLALFLQNHKNGRTVSDENRDIMAENDNIRLIDVSI